MFNTPAAIYPPYLKPANPPTGIHRGTPVRYQNGHRTRGGEGQTGIVVRRRLFGLALTVQWTTLDVTTVLARNVTPIER
jgi:hypothetical protein